MSRPDEETTVRQGLAAMIGQARSEGKWMFCSYQQIWMSPSQLEAENANGKFLWDPVNWMLRDPQERLDQVDREITDKRAERARFEKAIGERRPESREPPPLVAWKPE